MNRPVVFRRVAREEFDAAGDRELAEVLEDVIDHYQKNGKPLPSPKIRPMMEVI